MSIFPFQESNRMSEFMHECIELNLLRLFAVDANQEVIWLATTISAQGVGKTQSSHGNADCGIRTFEGISQRLKHHLARLVS